MHRPVPLKSDIYLRHHSVCEEAYPSLVFTFALVTSPRLQAECRACRQPIISNLDTACSTLCRHLISPLVSCCCCRFLFFFNGRMIWPRSLVQEAAMTRTFLIYLFAIRWVNLRKAYTPISRRPPGGDGAHEYSVTSAHRLQPNGSENIR